MHFRIDLNALLSRRRKKIRVQPLCSNRFGKLASLLLGHWQIKQNQKTEWGMTH